MAKYEVTVEDGSTYEVETEEPRRSALGGFLQLEKETSARTGGAVRAGILTRGTPKKRYEALLQGFREPERVRKFEDILGEAFAPVGEKESALRNFELSYLGGLGGQALDIATDPVKAAEVYLAGEAIKGLFGLPQVSSFLTKERTPIRFLKERLTGRGATRRLKRTSAEQIAMAQKVSPKIIEKRTGEFGDKAFDLIDASSTKPTVGNLKASLLKSIDDIGSSLEETVEEASLSKGEAVIRKLIKKFENIGDDVPLTPNDITKLRQQFKQVNSIGGYDHDLSIAFDNFIEGVQGKVSGLTEHYASYAPFAQAKKFGARRLGIFKGQTETTPGANILERAVGIGEPLGGSETLGELGGLRLFEKEFGLPLTQAVRPAAKGLGAVRTAKRATGLAAGIGAGGLGLSAILNAIRQASGGGYR